MRGKRLMAGVAAWVAIAVILALGFTSPAADAASMPSFESLPPISIVNSSSARDLSQIAVTVDGLVYVTESTRNSIAVITPEGAKVGSINSMTAPQGIAVNSQGMIFVTTTTDKSVARLNRQGSRLGALGKGAYEFSRPVFVAIDPANDEVYVTDQNASAVKVYNAAGTWLRTIPNGNLPIAAVVYGDTLYVLDQPLSASGLRTAGISVYNKNTGVAGSPFGEYGINIGQMFRPKSMAVDTAGRLFVLDNFHRVVYCFDGPNHAYLGAIYNMQNNPLALPIGVAISKSGKLFVASSGEDKLRVFGLDNYTVLGVTPEAFAFTLINGVSNPSSGTLSLSNTGKGTLSYLLSAATADGADWLHLSQTAGTLEGVNGTAEELVTISGAGLQAGAYTGTITVQDVDNAVVPPAVRFVKQIPVTLTVSNPALQVSTDAVAFESKFGETIALSRDLIVTLSGDTAGSVTWTAGASTEDAGNWLGINPSTQTGNSVISAAVTADPTGLSAGVYHGLITFNAPGAAGAPATVQVTLTVKYAGSIDVTTNRQDSTFSISGPNGIALSGGGQTWSQTGQPDGVYTITYGAVAGSITPQAETKTLSGGGTLTFTGNYTDDTTAPVLTVSSLSDGSWTNNPVLNVGGSATDNIGLRQVTVNGTVVPVNADFTFSYPVVLLEGANTITVEATDLAGNHTTDTRVIGLDRSAPVLTINTPADNMKTKQTPVDISGTVDEQSTVVITLNGAEATQAVMDGSGGFSLQVVPVYGLNTVEVTVTDRAANTSTAKRTFTFDDRNPAVSITEPTQDVMTNQANMTLKGEVSDITAVTVTITMDGNTYAPVVSDGRFEQPVTFTEEKVYQIYVNAVNEVGNETVVQRNVVYDITSPVVTLDPVTSPTDQTGQILSGTLDAGASVTVSCPTANVGQVLYSTETTWTAMLSDMQTGSNAIEVSAVDRAGNVSMNNATAVIVVGALNTISVTTSIPDATFTIAGPVQYSGTGSQSFSSALSGTYTITYGDVAGYITPQSETQSISGGGTLTFTGLYTVKTSGNIIVITNRQDSTFTISGPNGIILSGGGETWSQTGQPAGVYTITYGAVAGSITPQAETRTLSGGQTLTFTGLYRELRNIVVASGGSLQGPSKISIFNSDLVLAKTITPFGGKYQGAITVAVGDVDGDGYDEVIAAYGANVANRARISVFRRDGTQLANADFIALDSTFTFGARVAAGDFDGDGRAEIVVGAGPGEKNKAVVRIFSYSDGIITDTGVYAVPFTSYYGVNVAAGDLDGDGADELIVGPGPDPAAAAAVVTYKIDTTVAGSWHVQEESAMHLTPFESVYGANVASGDLDGDGIYEVIAGTGLSASATGSKFTAFRGDGSAYGLSVTDGASGGLEICAGDISDDGKDEILTAYGPVKSNSATVKVYSDGKLVTSYEAFRKTVYGAKVAFGRLGY